MEKRQGCVLLADQRGEVLELGVGSGTGQGGNGLRDGAFEGRVWADLEDHGWLFAGVQGTHNRWEAHRLDEVVNPVRGTDDVAVIQLATEQRRLKVHIPLSRSDTQVLDRLEILRHDAPHMRRMIRYTGPQLPMGEFSHATAIPSSPSSPHSSTNPHASSGPASSAQRHNRAPSLLMHLLNEPPAMIRRPHRLPLFTHHPRRIRRRHLTAGMPGNSVRPHPKRRQKICDGELHRTETKICSRYLKARAIFRRIDDRSPWTPEPKHLA